MSVALDMARVRAPAGEETFRGEYLRALRMIERLHRLLLDVIKDEFDREGGAEINSVQALLLNNMGDDRGTQATSDDVGLLVQQTVGQDAKFLVTDAGLAGEVAATVSLKGIPTSNVTIGDLSMRLEINNTTQAVNETFTGLASPLVLPAGPYVRVEVGTPSVRVSLTPKGVEARETIQKLYQRQLTSVEAVGQVSLDDFKSLNKALVRLERFWTDQIRYRL